MTLLLCGRAAAQEFPDSLFEGFWVGELTQDPGGMAERYPFRMRIRVLQNHRVEGRTYANIYDDPNFVNFDFTGHISKGKLLTFQETKMVEGTKMKDYEWCIKGGQLMLSVEKDRYLLRGFWQGVTEQGYTCIPGKIFLEKKRAP